MTLNIRYKVFKMKLNSLRLLTSNINVSTSSRMSSFDKDSPFAVVECSKISRSAFLPLEESVGVNIFFVRFYIQTNIQNGSVPLELSFDSNC